MIIKNSSQPLNQKLGITDYFGNFGQTHGVLKSENGL